MRFMLFGEEPQESEESGESVGPVDPRSRPEYAALPPREKLRRLNAYNREVKAAEDVRRWQEYWQLKTEG
jgi:hypothetical protein